MTIILEYLRSVICSITALLLENFKDTFRAAFIHRLNMFSVFRHLRTNATMFSRLLLNFIKKPTLLYILIQLIKLYFNNNNYNFSTMLNYCIYLLPITYNELKSDKYHESIIRVHAGWPTMCRPTIRRVYRTLGRCVDRRFAGIRFFAFSLHCSSPLRNEHYVLKPCLICRLNSRHL